MTQPYHASSPFDEADKESRMKIRRHRGAGAGAAVLVAAVTVGLIAHGHHTDRGIVLTKSDPLILVSTSADNFSLAALTKSRLVYLSQQKCLAVANPSYTGNPALLPNTAGQLPVRVAAAVWPPNTRAVRQGDHLGLEIPAGGTIWVGDTFTTGGGSAPDGSTDGLPKRLPKACYDGGLLLINSVRTINHSD